MEREKPYLSQKSAGFQWDWWKESPVEIILVVFILVLFLIPRAGCGITPKGDLAAAPAPAAAEVPSEAPSEP